MLNCVIYLFAKDVVEHRRDASGSSHADGREIFRWFHSKVSKLSIEMSCCLAIHFVITWTNLPEESFFLFCSFLSFCFSLLFALVFRCAICWWNVCASGIHINRSVQSPPSSGQQRAKNFGKKNKRNDR